MSYTKTNWQNTPSTQTPISAANLNHMEQGIYDAAQTADSAQSGVDGLDPRMDLVEQRLDNLIPQGTPTQGNAELIDIRVGANGVTYPDAGSAVRGQVTEIKSALSEVNDVGDNLGNLILYSVGKKLLGNGTWQDDASYSYTDYLSCDASTKYFFNELTAIVVVFYDSLKQYISSSNATSFTTPATAAFMRYSLPTTLISSVKLTKGILYQDYVDELRKSVKTTEARKYARFGQTTGTAYFPSTTKAYISGFVANGFLTYNIIYPPTIRIYALYVKTSGVWAQKTVYARQCVLTLTSNDEDVAITFSNSANDSTTLTDADLAYIYVSTVHTDYTHSESVSVNYVENSKISTDVNVGQSVSFTPTSDEWYRHTLLHVKSGEIYRTIGSASNTAARWAITDENSILLAKSATLTADETIAITQDGYLICNTRKDVSFGVYLVGESGFTEATKAKLENKKFETWNTNPSKPYYILALDCAKKYFTISNIKSIIDEASSQGFNQLQIQLSTDLGFRMELDGNMTITGADGVTTYDLTPCLGGEEAPTMWYDIADMDEIISYANSKGMDVSPFIPMPAHMRKILLQFPQFAVTGANYCLDFMNDDAVYFGIEIIKKYARYFASRGCHFYNIGTDEVGAYGNFEGIYASGKFRQLADFVNLAIQTVKECSLTPRIYNEVVAYEDNYEYQISKDAEVLVWKMTGSPFATPNKIQQLGYDVVNSSSWYYYIDGSGMSISPEYLVAVDPLICYGGFSNNFNHPTSGVVMSIWCDQSVTEDPGDGGDAVTADVLPLIDYFGRAIYNANTKYIG